VRGGGEICASGAVGGGGAHGCGVDLSSGTGVKRRSSRCGRGAWRAVEMDPECRDLSTGERAELRTRTQGL